MKKVSYIDNNLFSPKDAWDALSMEEKAEMMKVAVQNGITNLDDIRREYNEFAEGGYISKAKSLIKKNEGWMAKPYKDAPKGKSWRSVGYGFNDSGFYDKYPEGISRHYENGITKAQAEQELSYILNKADKHLRSIYGKQWDSFNDNQKAAIMDTYYQRPASVGKKSAFYNAVKSGKDASKYLGVNGFADRNKKRQSVFGGGAVPMVADNIDTSLPQEVAFQPIVDNIPEFIPLNPQAFNTTLPTYQRPELTFEEPVVQETPVSPYSPEEIERQERAEGLANLGRFLSFTNTSGSNNPFLNTIGMLTGNTFAEGGEKWTMQDESNYRAWRASLPSNLRNTDDNDYDMRGAFKAGMIPTLESDGYYHLGSRDPRTGRILKAPHHPTYLQAINTDARMGYYPQVDRKGNTYTSTWKGNMFAGGGDTNDADLVDWIIREEGFNNKPEDIGDGKITLGSGLTDPKWHALYKKRGNKWSAEDNRMAVAEEVANRRKWAEKNIPNWDTLPDSAQKALLSYKYNYNFTSANSPKLFQALRDSNLYEAAKQMDATSKDPKFKKGLMDRRKREQEWFLSDVAGNAAPTQAIPVQAPVTINTSMIPLTEPAVSTAVRNNYVPATTTPYNRGNNMRRAFESAVAFNRMMDATSLQNNPLPEYQFPISYADGGKIHIKPSKKGTFTAAASKHGMGVQEFAFKVLANKENYSPAMVKKANFARNASKWHGLGGNLFDGTSEDSQQMTRPNIFQRPDGSYFYSANDTEIDVTPMNTLGDNPAQWTYTDSSGKIYRPAQSLSPNYTLTESENTNPLVSAANNYFRELDWRAKNDPASIALQGKYTMPLVLSPILGKGAAVALTNPYVDAALTSGFGAHGLQSLANGEADWTTALEIAPLGRLAKPLYKEAATAIENYKYPLGRLTVPKNYTNVTPKIRTRVGDVEIDNPNLLYHLDRGDSAGAFSNRGAYIEDGFLFPGTPKEASDIPYSWWNEGKPYSTSVNGQPMTRLMTATKNAPGMIHVRSQNYPIGQWNGKRGFVRNTEYVNPEEVNVSGNTYILEPNYGWKKTPSEVPTIEWAEAKEITPQITAENAASITPAQWTAAQDVAIAKGDMAEAQRLRDLHFKVSAPNTFVTDNLGNPLHTYHGGAPNIKSFNILRPTLSPQTHTKTYGAYFSPNKQFATIYEDMEKQNVMYDTYLNLDKMADMGDASMIDKATYNSLIPRFNSVYGQRFDEYVSFNPNRIKLADAVTYDDKGVRIPLGERDNFGVNDIRYLKGKDIHGDEYELPARTLRGGIVDANGNLISDEELVANWKRSQDFYKMRLRSRGLTQQGNTYVLNRDNAYKKAVDFGEDSDKNIFLQELDDLGGAYAAPDGQDGYGIVTKELNNMGKQRRGTTNSGKVHEDSHLMRSEEEVQNLEKINWSSLNLDKDEAAARGTQIKSMLGIKDNTPITADQLKYMQDNFVRLTGMDNNMQAFLNSITDFEKAAKWLSKNAYSLGGALNLLGLLKHPSGKKGL